MKLKNVLIVVSNVENSIVFYRDLFGLQVVFKSDGNVIMTEGLVLQDRQIWEQTIQKDVVPGNHATELYFEEVDWERFVDKLEAYGDAIRYLNEPAVNSFGRKIVRFYDPDGNLIEVGETV